eukprot:5192411-Pleurochrysis_carterae.AAC.7
MFQKLSTTRCISVQGSQMSKKTQLCRKRARKAVVRDLPAAKCKASHIRPRAVMAWFAKVQFAVSRTVCAFQPCRNLPQNQLRQLRYHRRNGARQHVCVQIPVSR